MHLKTWAQTIMLGIAIEHPPIQRFFSNSWNFQSNISSVVVLYELQPDSLHLSFGISRVFLQKFFLKKTQQNEPKSRGNTITKLIKYLNHGDPLDLGPSTASRTEQVLKFDLLIDLEVRIYPTFA